MSRPFIVALVGLLFTLAVLAIGEAFHIKGAVPVAFVVGGGLTFGGLAVGLLRSLTGGRGQP